MNALETHITIDLSSVFDENGYLDNCDVSQYNTNANVIEITLTQSINKPIKICNNFICNFSNLTTVNVNNINVVSIGDNFLYNCNNLIHFDASKFTDLVHVGNNFMHKCSKLEHFDTVGFINLNCIGDYFLAHCEGLKHFDTRGLTTLSQVGYNFLAMCFNLTVFDARPLRKLKNVGHFFLHHCDSLTHFDTRTLIKLTNVGKYFLCNMSPDIIIYVRYLHSYICEHIECKKYCIRELHEDTTIHLTNECVI